MVLEVDEETKEALREAFKDMVNNVECLVFVSNDPECEYCQTTLDLCELLRETSNGKIIVKVFWKEKDEEVFQKYFVNRVPSVLLYNGYIRYTGIPAGEEVRGLVETIIRLSTNDPGLNPQTIAELKTKLKGKAYVEVIVTPTCPYCPYAALEANMFAFASEGKVIADTVEALENSDIADMYGVTAVPTVAINGNVEFVGVPREDMLLKAILKHQKENIKLPFHPERIRYHPHLHHEHEYEEYEF